MTRKTKSINRLFQDRLSQALRKRLNKLGMTKYALCRDNKFNPLTCNSILSAKGNPHLSTVLDFLDAVGLELRIIDREEDNEKA